MNEKSKKILRPLYVFAFVEALIFWYATEKLLWNSRGITAEQIILLGIIAQSSQVLIEVPSSILADRWSRRKTLMLSSVFMLISILIVLSSQTFTSFAIMALAWALYFSFQSGTINAYIFDLLKEKGEESQYRKALSRFATLQLSGAILASLAASPLVEIGSFLTPYQLTLVPTIVAILLLWKMHDPPIERTKQSTGKVHNHVKAAIKNINKKSWLRLVFVSLAFITAGRFIWYEYYQLYALNREITALLFGAILALILIGNILGSEFAHRVRRPSIIMATSFIMMIASSISLAFVSSTPVVIFLLMVCFFGSQASSIVLDESLQHETDSELRATTLSLMGLMSRIIFGIGALVIINFNATPEAIALVSTVIFLGITICWPAAKNIYVSAE
ncbi:MFS transporter [Candidatus Saccharibacteria bacterium]|nr:MFS transporter [Candidatus Saccharibacteria bacterium]